MSLARNTSIGVIWSFAEQLARRGVGVVVTLALAKFLVPEDFGLLAMVTLFLALGQSLMDSGFRQALIRLPQITPTDYSTAFYANIALGLVSYGLLFFSAPVIADFYDELRLTDLIRVLSLAVIINSFQAVQVASLSRSLQFKVQMQAAVPASVFSGIVAIAFAYFGFGVWALVAHSLLAAVVHTATLWWLHGWRPTRNFSWSALKQMYHFGYKLFLSGSLEIFFKNMYPLVIAKAFTASAAGLYFFADRIRDLVVSQILTSIQTVTFPALSKKQANISELKSGYRRVIKVIIALYVPIVAGLILVAPWLFELFFEKEWYSAHKYLQILCFAALLQPIHSLNLNILRVLGRSDILLKLQVFKKLVALAVLLIAMQISLEAILWGQVIQSVLFYFPNKYYSDRLVGYSFMEQFNDVALYYLASAVIFGVTTLVVIKMQAGALVSLSLACVIFPILYFSVIYLFDKPLIKEIVRVVKRA